MGVYLCITDADGNDRPDWDFGLAGDFDICRLLINLPHVEPEGNDPLDTTILRPSDFAEARAAESKLDPHRPNPDRYRELLNRLEENPDEWIYISW